MVQKEPTQSYTLLVDDDKDVCTVLGSGLQRRGFKVTALNDPFKAVDEFKARRYDKIVIDVKMNGITGFQLAKKIWQLDPEARVCFLSAFEIYEKETKMMFKDLKNVCFIKNQYSPASLPGASTKACSAIAKIDIKGINRIIFLTCRNFNSCQLACKSY